MRRESPRAKMDERSVCTPQSAESDARNNTTSAPNAASATDADKVINTKTDSARVEGVKSEDEVLRGLLTDDYCHVCEAVLLFESQRLSHYEGKKHAQKLRVYLQARRAEMMNKGSTRPQRTMTTDKDCFCELCNMVFSSPVVAKSHYEGKVHSKNLRKQSLKTADRYTEETTVQTQDPAKDDHRSAPEVTAEHLLDPTADVVPKDPNKFCALCAASFNNPQMALQHYNGRKHQRNEARQELLKELGDNVHQASPLMCQMCSIQFNSVEMYQAHMQGNKHQTREKKVVDLCKSQQKSYSTFADELADYIQVQKARGITPRTGQVLPAADAQKNDEQEEVADVNREYSTPMPGHPPVSTPPHHSAPSCYHPAELCRPLYQGPPWPPRGWSYIGPPPPILGSSPQHFTPQSLKRARRRNLSSSSSSSTTTSSSSSSDSSSFSSSSSTRKSDNSECRRRETRRLRRSRRARGEDSDREGTRRKQRRREINNEPPEGRGEECGESEKDSKRKKRKNHSKRRRRERKPPEEDLEQQEGEAVMDTVQPKDMTELNKETEAHTRTEMSIEQREDESAKPKYRKEKRKTKGKVDTRTEEEKLWDDSILGC